MVTLRIWSVVLVGIVLALLSQEASAADTPTPAKSECPKECARRAKAAFAFAALKAEAAQPTTAPMPTPKRCVCGDICPCAPGDCPGKCVVSGISKAIAPPATIPAPMPQTRQLVIVGYQCQVDRFGNKTCVPVYGEK